MELFVIIVNGFQPLTVITKCSILDVAAALDPPLNKLTAIKGHLYLATILYPFKTTLLTESNDFRLKIMSSLFDQSTRVGIIIWWFTYHMMLIFFIVQLSHFTVVNVQMSILCYKFKIPSKINCIEHLLLYQTWPWKKWLPEAS